MKFIYTIDIDSTPETVFSWLGYPERAMEWQSSISKTEIVHKTPNMIGTTFREIVEENGSSVEMNGMVTDYRENQALAMHLEGKYNKVDVEYHLEKIDEFTRLTLIANIRFRSFMRIISILLWPAFKKKLIEQLNREYTKLKKLCERDT